MGQTKLESLFESVMNIVVGFVVAILSQIAIFPLFDIHIPLSSNLWIGAWFTVISLVRSYTIRRFFNSKIKNTAHTMAELCSTKG